MKCESVSETIPQNIAAVVLAVFMLLAPVSHSTDAILRSNENCTLGNCTLHVVDVDSQVMQVWLVITSGNESLQPSVLGINDTIDCGNCTLLIKRIYAGEESDLVCLETTLF